MSEVVLITLDADVVSFNNTTKTWQPFGDKCNVTISNDPELNYVKILVKSNNNILLNNAINAKLKYNEATPNFHQWRDSTGIYGIKFQNETHASNFASKIKEAMIISSTPPVSKISGNTTATVKTQMSYRSAPPPPPSSRAPVPSSTGLPPAPPVPPAPIAPPASIPSFTPGSIPAPPPCPPGGIPAPPPLVAPSQSSSVAVDGDLSSALLSVKLKKSQPLSETSIVSNSSSAAAPPVQSSGGGGGDLLSEMARKLANRQEAMAKKLTNEAPSVDNSSSNSSQPVQSTNQSLNRNPSFLPKNQNQPNTTLKKNDGNSSAKNSPTTNCISANLNLNTPILTSEMKKELITNVNQMIDQFRTQLIEVINKFPSQ